MLSWLIMSSIGQLDIQQNCLTTNYIWLKEGCSFTTRLVLAKQCLHLVFSEQVMCYITPVEAWESSSLGAGRHRFSQLCRASSQPSLRWHLQGTCLALTIFLLFLLDKDLSFKLKNPISNGMGFFFLVPCIIFHAYFMGSLHNTTWIFQGLLFFTSRILGKFFSIWVWKFSYYSFFKAFFYWKRRKIKYELIYRISNYWAEIPLWI